MEIQPIVDQIAKAVAFIDEADTASLEQLRMQLLTLKEAAQSDNLEGIVSSCDMGLEAVSELMGEPEDGSSFIEILEEVAGYASQVLEAIDMDLEPASVPHPSEESASTTASDSDVDPELIAMFVGSTLDNVADLEQGLLALEAGHGDSESAEQFAQIKRSLHTIKGECGVIPLHEAQSLCHAAEDLFDRFDEAGAEMPFPVLLEVADWIGSYANRLADGDWTTVPEYKNLLDRLKSSEPGGAVASAAEPVEAPVAEVAPEPAAPAPVAPAPAAPEMVDDGSRISFPTEILEDEVLPDFIGEAREHIEASEAALLDLEHEPEDIELINAIFRAFHTVKGVAGYLNLKPMVELAHTAETLMDQLRKGDVICGKLHLDLIFSSCDVMNSLVAALEGGEGPLTFVHRKLVDDLKEVIEGGPGAAPAPVAAEPAAPVVAQPTETRKLLQILVEQELITEKLSEVLLKRQEKVKGKPIGEIAVGTGLITQDAIDEALEIQREEREAAQAAAAAPQPVETPQLPTEQAPAPDFMDMAEPEVPEVSAPTLESAPMATAPAPEAASAEPQTTIQPAGKKAEKPAKKAARKPRVASTIKVSTARLDSLVDLVGELVIAQQMICQDPDIEQFASERLTRNLSQVAKITRDMHEAAMSLRMVTLKQTFQKMARLVRDVSSKAGKEVNLVLTGEDTELDRNVVEEISDPMVHLIRNAVDHGLETPEQRKAAGKTASGQIELRAFHQGGSIVIEIVDDGAGLSRERILAKAVEKDVIPPDMIPEEMTDSQVWELIFQPGFSTAAVVSDISGRGVGMDVVRRNIEKMRGKVEIVSKEGHGSVFSLRLPLTLAIIDGMIVRVGSQRYVLPTLSIEQGFRPTKGQLHGVMNDGELVKVRDMLLPINRLGQLFGQDDGIADPEEGLLIVLEDNGGRCCLMVDEMLGQQQVVIKSLGEVGSNMKGISGGAILGDGLIALIVDVDGIVTRTTQPAA